MVSVKPLTFAPLCSLTACSLSLTCWLITPPALLLPFKCGGFLEGLQRTSSSLPPSLCLKVTVTSAALMQVCAHEAQMLLSSLDLSSQGQVHTSGYFIVTESVTHGSLKFEYRKQGL